MSDGAKGFLAGVLLILCVWAATGLLSTSDSEPVSAGGQFATTTTAAAANSGGETTEAPQTTLAEAPEAVQFSDLDPISMDELPPEAIETINLIFDDGPYPFRQDDGVFQNREGILPDFERGHYREYTVVTPGASNRGARRIVAGQLGELYYTSDHYQSFREVVS